MSENLNDKSESVWLAVIAVLFGLLLLASQSNELLKQVVIAPGSSAESALEADCRPDELEEENLSLDECRLMLANVQLILASSPDWFRPFQIGLSLFGAAAALLSMASAFRLFSGAGNSARLAVFSFSLLLLVDIAGFIAAVNTGPLLRAQYLWPLLLWFFIHLCMLMAVIKVALEQQGARN